MTQGPIEIREFREGDLETVVQFSLRAWAPVYNAAGFTLLPIARYFRLLD